MDRYWVLMLNKDFKGLGVQIDKSWYLNQKLDAGTNTPEIQRIIDRIKPWLVGQKLPGAGGGGLMLMIAKDEEAAVCIKKCTNGLSCKYQGPVSRFFNFQDRDLGF